MGLFYYPHLSGKCLDVIKGLYLLSVIPLTAIIFISNESSFIWAKRIIIYFIVMVVSLFLSSTILRISEFFLNINIDGIDIDNARYMLSSLIQSEAAIIAIVITLTLVAVQQTSTLYSTRLIDIFKSKNPDFWILIIIYLGSITYQLIILTDLNKSTIEKNHIFFSFFAGLFSFISLIPYMLKTIDLLKPLTMLTILSEKITKSNFLLIDPNYYNIYNYSDLNLKSVSLDNNIKDPILPLVDIINSSLMKNDYDTSRDGLLIIRKRSIQILDDDNINDREFENIYKLFSKYFFRRMLQNFQLLKATKYSDVFNKFTKLTSR